jgi:lipopolysaccharide export system permease protein
MTVFSRYIMTQVGRPTVSILLVALFALLAERMLRVVDIVVGWRGSLLVIFEMMGYLLPHYLTLAVPAAFFIAILLTVSRMSRDGELDAMTASGVGLWGILRPLLGLSVLLLVINALVLSYLQPYSRYAYRASLFALSNVSFQALLHDRSFVTLDNTTYSVDSLGTDRSGFSGLFLYSRQDNGGTMTVTAEHGSVLPAKGSEPLTLSLEDGVQQIVPAPSSGQPEAAPKGGASIHFKSFLTDMRGAEPQSFRPRGEDEREMTIPELWAARGHSFPGIRPAEISSELSGRLVRIVSTLVLPLIAVPLAIARRRSLRSYGILVGIAVLLIYNQILQFGESTADDGKISSLLGLWAPFFVFLLLGLVLSWHKGTRVPRSGGRGPIEAMIEGVTDRLARLGRGEALRP